MNKSTGILLAAFAFFAGISAGFALSPIKKGIKIRVSIGNNSGNNNNANSAALEDKSSLPDKIVELKSKTDFKKGLHKWIGRK